MLSTQLPVVTFTNIECHKLSILILITTDLALGFHFCTKLFVFVAILYSIYRILSPQELLFEKANLIPHPIPPPPQKF